MEKPKLSLDSNYYYNSIDDAISIISSSSRWEEEQHMLLDIFKKTNQSLESKILDFGCGIGRNSIYLKQNGFNNIEGIDQSETGINFAKEINESIPFYTWNEWIPQKYDIIVSMYVIQHNSNVEEITDFLISCLNEAGKLVIIEQDHVFESIQSKFSSFEDFTSIYQNQYDFLNGHKIGIFSI